MRSFRLSVDLPEDDEIVCMFVYQAGAKRLIVSAISNIDIGNVIPFFFIINPRYV